MFGAESFRLCWFYVLVPFYPVSSYSTTTSLTFCPLTTADGITLYTTATPDKTQTSDNLMSCALDCLADKQCTQINYTDTAQTCSMFYSAPPYITTTDTSTYCAYRIIKTFSDLFTNTPTSLQVPIQNCSLPRTENGQLIYNCTPTIQDSCTTCLRYACPVNPVAGLWATCTPSDYQVYNLTINLSIPTFNPFPALSVNNWITIFQRFTTNNTVFIKDFNMYANGFGTISGDFWMGNEKVHLLTQNGSRPYMLRVEVLSTRNIWRSAEYTSFSLDDESNFYRLHVDGPSGDAGDSLQYTGYSHTVYHNGMKFSTFDSNNDLYQDRTFACSTKRGYGGWGFNGCLMCCLTCDAPNYSWWTNPDNDVYLEISRMMIKST